MGIQTEFTMGEGQISTITIVTLGRDMKDQWNAHTLTDHGAGPKSPRSH
jgi:hypothetical protein